MGRNPFRPKAPVTWPQPRRREGGKRQARPGSLQAQTENGKQPTPFYKSLRTPKARLHEGMPSCQPIREYQFGFANLEKEACRKKCGSRACSRPFGY